MLTNRAKALQEEMNELKAAMNKATIGLIDFDTMIEVDPDQLSLLFKCYKFMNSSMEYFVEEAKTLDRIEEKLDALINSKS